MTRSPSLKRPLIVYPLVFHFVTLLVSFSILIAVALRIDSGGPYTDERIIPIIADAVERDAAGGLSVVMTWDLADLRTEAPDLWFVAEDDQGERVVFGTVPEHYASLLGRLSDLSYAQLRGRVAPYELAAVIRRETTEIGTLTILGHGALSELGFMVVFATNTIILPIFALLTLTSLLVTPWIVRRSLAGVSRIAREAEEIDADSRGRRLSETYVPQEIAPLVRAVNDALSRLDDGYERQRRFIASASHELRTPIAVLASKVDTAESRAVRALALDVQRLATMTEQLLDLHRLENNRQEMAFELAAVGRRVVADLAPLVIASGGSISLDVVDSETCTGDAAALERVLMNLVQNAMDHGGTNIVVRVLGTAFEVEDDGPGIPPHERERVFEPFHRLRPRATGTGLGLNLVREVMDQHGGKVEIRDAPGGGTVFRVDLGGV
ncbi:sensor histidine kinase [Roseicyclus mahoneyensis]|uniref:histidine kinase n=1 Tax=Roseicyclus mahoneyensis TaxID=164332 RepID=A0A316GGG1_9RHOB|nr:HAMP domain-containing sensor histidine kinase [Roseicyclus mahoneyensis]PWK59674.1 signal transduction histidine kinase [Roseicyclus mahoneyensis]